MTAAVAILPIERTCKTCEVGKPLAEFHFYAPGKASWRCKPCHREAEQKRQRALWTSDPGYRERHNAAGKAYRRGDVQVRGERKPFRDAAEGQCKVCGVTKPIADFPLRGEGHRLRTCADCYKLSENAKARLRYRDDLDERAKHLAAAKAAYRRRRAAGNPMPRATHTRDYYARYFYGVSFADIDKILEQQLGLCANRACGAEISWDAPRGSKGRAVIDHNHSTGKFRAVLCHPCNVLLGHVEKSKNTILGLFEYEKKHAETRS